VLHRRPVHYACAAGEALADVLFGHAAPSGRLPVMVPTSEAQLPADYLDQSMQAGDGRTHRYFRGTPLYPFGFGLGYSTFAYSDLALSHAVLRAGAADVEAVLTVSVTVYNRGEYAFPSDEAVLVFAVPHVDETPTTPTTPVEPGPVETSPSKSEAPTMAVPRQLLVGFRKVSTMPGGSTRVDVRVPARRLRLVGADGEAFGLLRGRYELRVGSRAGGQGVGVVMVGEPLTASLVVR
jgi:beta-glucosidase